MGVEKKLMMDFDKTLAFNSVHYSYPGIGVNALNGITAAFRAGEKVALIGRNGGGKSTLMLIANGVLQPRSGYIALNGQKVEYDRKDLLELRRTVGVVFQNPEDQLFSANVMQDISLGPLNLGMTEAEARKRVLEAAEICELTDLMERPTHALSGGEKTRAALAGVLAMDPHFLFADELTNSLDPWMRNKVLDILNKWVGRGHTVVLATHDWQLVSEWAQRVIWLEEGKIYRQGTAREVLSNADLPLEFEYPD